MALCSLTLTFLALLVLQSRRFDRKYVIRSALFLFCANWVVLYSSRHFEQPVQSVDIFDQ